MNILQIELLFDYNLNKSVIIQCVIIAKGFRNHPVAAFTCNPLFVLNQRILLYLTFIDVDKGPTNNHWTCVYYTLFICTFMYFKDQREYNIV